MKDILNAIQVSGALTCEQIKTIIESLFLFQTGVYEMNEDDFRAAAEEAMDDE